MIRFVIVEDENGWTILDNLSGMAVIANAKTQIGLSFDHATLDAELMNLLHSNQQHVFDVVVTPEIA